MEHISVLKNEVIEVLSPKPGENFVDLTLGLGGHAKEILKKTGPDGELLGVDQDEIALEKAKLNLKNFKDRFHFYLGNFIDLGLIVRNWDVSGISGVLLDLGPSTYQLTDINRGFSFKENSKLDMRMNQSQRLSAYEIVNNYSEKEIQKVLFAGEERFAKPIARKICQVRREGPIFTTFELREVIKKATPPDYRFASKTHFATGTFRSLRMEVNHELDNLKNVLPQIFSILPSGGRIAVISFHSLEDRIVKKYFSENQNLKLINNQPIVASADELMKNPSARSAKLRGAVKI
jgi:16S rRNA (cytosine1402-N4)-methyltransferase